MARYNPKDVEPKWRDAWASADVFRAPNASDKPKFYILDTRLRADGLNVEVFKQVAVGGVWTDAQPSPQTETDLENAILTRARQLRLANVNQ